MTAEIRAVSYRIFKAKCRLVQVHGARQTCVQQALGCQLSSGKDDTIIIIGDLGLAAFEHPFTNHKTTCNLPNDRYGFLYIFGLFVESSPSGQ
jgi:hypothetical protein